MNQMILYQPYCISALSKLTLYPPIHTDRNTHIYSIESNNNDVVVHR